MGFYVFCVWFFVSILVSFNRYLQAVLHDPELLSWPDSGLHGHTAVGSQIFVGPNFQK